MKLTPEDILTVAEIMFHKDVFETIADDHGMERFGEGRRSMVPRAAIASETAKLLLNSPNLLLLHPAPGVLFMLETRTLTMFEVHTMIVPEARGKQAVRHTIDAACWVFENTTCQKIITHIPVFNRAARVHAKRCGMKLEGVNTKSFLKNGTLIDQWVMGLEKEALCQP